MVSNKVIKATVKLLLAKLPKAAKAKPKPMIAATEPVTIGGSTRSKLALPTALIKKPTAILIKPVTTIPACKRPRTSSDTGPLNGT